MQNDSSEQETSSNLPEWHSLSELVTKILQRLRWIDAPTQQCSRRKGECGTKQGFPQGTLSIQEKIFLSKALTHCPLHLIWPELGQMHTRPDTAGSHDWQAWCICVSRGLARRPLEEMSA